MVQKLPFSGKTALRITGFAESRSRSTGCPFKQSDLGARHVGNAVLLSVRMWDERRYGVGRCRSGTQRGGALRAMCVALPVCLSGAGREGVVGQYRHTAAGTEWERPVRWRHAVTGRIRAGRAYCFAGRENMGGGRSGGVTCFIRGRRLRYRERKGPMCAAVAERRGCRRKK